MIKNKKMIIATTFILSVFFCGCTVHETAVSQAEQNKELFEINLDGMSDGTFGRRSISILQDKITNVQYIVVERPRGITITPRLNKDGKPYTGKGY